MNKLKAHYDKIILVITALILGILFFLSFAVQEPLKSPQSFASDFLPYEIEISDDKLIELEPRTMHQMMPGDYVSILEENGSLKEKIVIESILLQRRSEIEVILKGQEDPVSGRLASQEDLNLGLQWKSSRQTLAVSKGRTIQNIAYPEILAIRGYHRIVFAQPRGIDVESERLSFYQNKLKHVYFDIESPDRPKWTESVTEGNNTIYDLFTPPIIYLVDGKLSTSLPEDPLPTVEIEEVFGMELTRFSNEPYPLRLVSWIGDTPYFEDTLVKRSDTSDENIRNRLEVGVPYKRLSDRRPGQPSYVPTNEEDLEKQLTIEKFVVQQYTDEKTGGLKVIGRALVKDHKLGGKPFEINNQMKEVYAGNVKIEVRMTLEKLQGKVFSFTTSDQGISFDFGDRVYKVKAINELEKFITVEKSGPTPDQKSEQTLRLQ